MIAPRPKQRILAAFDPETSSSAATLTAVELAAKLGAELVALFVEDADLLKVAGLPFMSQLTAYGGRREKLESEALAAELRVVAKETEARVRKAAERRHVHWSFLVVRGTVAQAVAQAASDVDLLVLGAAARPLFGRPRRNPHAKTAVELSERPVILIPPNFRLTGPIALVFDPSRGEEGGRAAKAAAEIAARSGRPLEVYHPAALPPQEVETALASVLEARPARVCPLPRRLDSLLEQAKDGLIVVGMSSGLLVEASTWDLLAEARCALAFVR